VPEDENITALMLSKQNVNGYLLSPVGTPITLSSLSADYVYRKVAAANSAGSDQKLTNALDSHADTCCLGKHWFPLEEPSRIVTVNAYSPDLPSQQRPVQPAASVYESEEGERYLLIVHEALFFRDDMTESLINPNQLRANGIVVDDCPKQFSKDSTHLIYDPVTP
jgi:hypothetical protein